MLARIRSTQLIGMAVLFLATLEAFATPATAGTANVSITKTADRSSVHAFETIGFTITVTNAATAGARGVNISDPLPNDPGLAWSIDSQSGSVCSISSGTLSCPIGSLAAGGSYQVHISSPTTDETATSSPVDNRATVSATGISSKAATASVEVAPWQRIATTTVVLPAVSRPVVCGGLPPVYSMCFVKTFHAIVVAADGSLINEGTVVFDLCDSKVHDGLAACTSEPQRSGSFHATGTYNGSPTYAPSSGRI